MTVTDYPQTKPTRFDFDAAHGVLEHHQAQLSDMDKKVLQATIQAFETKREMEQSLLAAAREIFGVYRADGRHC